MSSDKSTAKAKRGERCPAAVAFGNHLREWRQNNDVSMKALAADLGLSVSTVSAWENGQRFPSGAHCDLVSEYLGQPVHELFSEDGTGRHKAD